MFGSSLASFIDVSDTDKLDYYGQQLQIEQLMHNQTTILIYFGFAMAALMLLAVANVVLLSRIPKDSVGPIESKNEPEVLRILEPEK